ncbi:MAG: hypothetical protein ABWW69_01215 [Pyrodictiaceae archaeon]
MPGLGEAVGETGSMSTWRLWLEVRSCPWKATNAGIVVFDPGKLSDRVRYR